MVMVAVLFGSLCRDDAPARLAESVVLLLVAGRPIGRRALHRRHLVFRAVGRPIREVGRDHVGLGQWVVECRVHDPPRNALGDYRGPGQYEVIKGCRSKVAYSSMGRRVSTGTDDVLIYD
jgi:hypothetical protein